MEPSSVETYPSLRIHEVVLDGYIYVVRFSLSKSVMEIIEAEPEIQDDGILKIAGLNGGGRYFVCFFFKEKTRLDS